ncbi:MAG: LytR/AlgR family response regulator transcription factor [Saprospiraceae bacterium]
MKHSCKALIVDDEPAARRLLKNLLHQQCPQVNVCGEAASVAEAVSQISHTRPDLIFMDIDLKPGTGFDVLQEAQGFTGKVIFTTGHDEFAVKAFKVNALDYLVKPIDPEELAAAVQKMGTSQRSVRMALDALMDALPPQKPEKILIPDREGVTVVLLRDIVRLKGDGNFTEMHRMGKKCITSSRPLKHFEELLPQSDFFRTHQSHIVNLHFVEKVLTGDEQGVKMQDGTKVELARRRQKELVAALGLA